MAKSKKESELTTWRDVDIAIRRLGMLDMRKAALESKMTVEINRIKEYYNEQAEEIKKPQTKLKTEIEKFCEQNKSGFLKSRSKKLNYGTVAYHLSESVKFTQPESDVIKMLEALNYDSVIKTTKKIDKNLVKGLDPNVLTKIGVLVVKKDGLTIVPDVAKIEGVEDDN